MKRTQAERETEMQKENARRWIDNTVFTTGGLSAILGAVVIIGWFTQNLALLKILPSFEAMRFNTALGFSLAGAGLVATVFKRKTVFRVCGLMVGLIGALTIIEYTFGVDIGIDQLFIKDTVSATYPGRLALPTAIGFTFIGSAFILLGTPRWTKRQHIFLGIPGSIIIALGVVGLIGFFSGHTEIGTWGDFVSMAFHTAVGLMLVGTGLIASAWRHSANEGRFLFQWLPVIIGVGVLTGTMLLWRVSVALERANIEKMVLLKTATLRANTNDRIESHIQALMRMANRWAMHGPPSKMEWESDAGLYVKHYGVYRSIMWVDPTLRARWVAPFKGNESEIGRYLGDDLGGSKALEAAREKRDAWISPAVPEKGGDVFAAYIPIFIPIFNHRFDGFIVGVFDVRSLFDTILKDEDIKGYDVSVSSNGSVIYTSGGAPGGWAREARVRLYGADFTVKIWPKADYLAGARSILPSVILASGILVSFLLALVGHFGEKAQERASISEAANARLEHEIFQRRRAEEELKANYAVIERNSEELKRSNAELEQFASVVSHDLQEPLRVISGYLQLLSRRYKGKLDESAEEFIRFSVEGAARMQNIISDLLAYSRVGSRTKNLSSVDCSEIVDLTKKNLGRVIQENGAVITSGPLPTVNADASQLGHLFMNLVGNAIKYRGDETPSVHISAKALPEEWLFSVADNGIGIDPAYSEKIFEMFQRLHGKGSKYTGTGIGLAICKKVVENHGGRIWIESTPGRGSTFFFTLPAKA